MKFTPRNRSLILASSSLLFVGILFAFQNFTAVNRVSTSSTTSIGASSLAMIDVGDGISYPIPVNTAPLTLDSLYSYLDNSPNIDTKVIAKMAVSLGYHVVSPAVDNAPPYSMAILQGPANNPTVLMDLWADPAISSTYASNESGFVCVDPSWVPVDFLRSGFSAAIASSNNKVKLDISKLDSKYAASITLAVGAMNQALEGQGAPTFTTGADTTAAKSVGLYCASSEVPIVQDNAILAVTFFYKPWIGTHPGGARISINCDKLPGDDLTAIIYHEMGHLLGLGDNKTNINSPMYYAQDPNAPLKPFTNAELHMIQKIYEAKVDPYTYYYCHDLTLTLNATAAPNPLPNPTTTVTPCSIRSCTGGFTFDSNSCSCVCSLSSCPSGYTYDSSNCVCTSAGSPNGNCGTIACNPDYSVLNLSTCQCDVISSGPIYTYPTQTPTLNPTGQPCEGEDPEECY